MTSGHGKPEENTTGHPDLVLEVPGQKKPTPLLIPGTYPEPVHGRGYLGGAQSLGHS